MPSYWMVPEISITATVGPSVSPSSTEPMPKFERECTALEHDIAPMVKQNTTANKITPSTIQGVMFFFLDAGAAYTGCAAGA